MKLASPYAPCKWDDVAVRKDALHFPFCSLRCKTAHEQEERASPVDKGAPSELPDQRQEGFERFVPLDMPLEFERLERTLPYPDELDEWEEEFAKRPHHERIYKLRTSPFKVGFF